MEKTSHGLKLGFGFLVQWRGIYGYPNLPPHHHQQQMTGNALFSVTVLLC